MRSRIACFGFNRSRIARFVLNRSRIVCLYSYLLKKRTRVLVLPYADLTILRSPIMAVVSVHCGGACHCQCGTRLLLLAASMIYINDFAMPRVFPLFACDCQTPHATSPSIMHQYIVKKHLTTHFSGPQRPP